jgi:MGT family glycosyltransferase
MSRILAYTSPALGHLFPMVPVLLELHRRGHEVHVRTLESQLETMRALGLQAGAIDHRVAAIEAKDHLARGPRRALVSATKTFTDRAKYDGPDLAAAVGQLNPDVLLVDANSWGAACAAEAGNTPWVSWFPYTPPLSSADTPPFGPGFPPAHGALGRLRDKIARPLVLGAAEKAMAAPLNTLRDGYGLPPVHTADELFLRAPLILVTTSGPFEYGHSDWDPRIRQIGALTWDPPTEEPSWLREIDGPLALVTTSSEYQGDEQLARTAVAALADEPYTVIVTLPAGMTHLGTLPPNVRAVEFVPHRHVLERSVVAVTHGGMGATQKALAMGVPVCVVPWGRDQLEVAARVVHSGSGTRVSRRRLTPHRLREAVRSAVTKSDGARRVANGYLAAGGANAGSNAIEQLLGKTPYTPGQDTATRTA